MDEANKKKNREETKINFDESYTCYRTWGESSLGDNGTIHRIESSVYCTKCNTKQVTSERCMENPFLHENAHENF